jgi:cell division protein FtsL
MQFDLSAVETDTLVFIGTLTVALLITVFMMTAAFAVIMLVGLGRLAWFVAAGTLLGLVHGINSSWERLAHHASTAGLPGDFQVDFQADFQVDFQGQSSPSTGTYPRVVLRDS